MSETYPSGRVVSTFYDAANRPVTMGGTMSGAAKNYIGDASVTSYSGDPNLWSQYAPHGAPWAYLRGNRVMHAETYNGRLQRTESYEAYNNSNTVGDMLFVSCPHWGRTGGVGLYRICPDGLKWRTMGT